MKFRDFVVRDAIITDLRASAKADAIREVVSSLADSGALPTPVADGVASAILAREGIATTALGRGVAFPHARHAGVPGLVGTIAIDRKGLEYGALDEQKVDILIAVVSPAAEAGRHLRVLEFLCAAVGGEPGGARGTARPRPEVFPGIHWLDKLREAKTRDEVVAVLDEVDRVFGTDR
ncbi:MAG: PTS sugar transporter subunit IIA [Isosphaeraceae bacterium]